MRKALFQLHLWLGVVVGLLWALQGLTGASLVFHREMDRWAVGSVAPNPMVSMDRIVVAAKARTGAPVAMVAIEGKRGDILNVHLAGEAPRQLQIEAATGRPLRLRDHDPSTPLDGSAWRWVYLLHESLLLHDRGETLIGISGLLLFTSLLTGIWLGFPKRRQWRQALGWRGWKSVRARLFGWHRLTGIIAGTLLLITVPGGIWMIFAGELRPKLALLVEHQLPFKPTPVAELGEIIAPQQALDAARVVFPNAAFVRVTMPTPAAPVYAIRLRQPDEIRTWSGVTSVTLDAATGRRLHTYDAASAPLSNRLADAAFSVHSAEIAGFGGRILLMLAGLSLPVLYVTGLWAWWRKRRPRRREVASRGACATSSA
ncbi:MAG: PepSY domain-containing protein [Pseudomonadota bacterium]|nr:PepSY domain-containing protein [Pseudomonadota bacterium]